MIKCCYCESDTRYNRLVRNQEERECVRCKKIVLRLIENEKERTFQTWWDEDSSILLSGVHEGTHNT